MSRPHHPVSAASTIAACILLAPAGVRAQATLTVVAELPRPAIGNTRLIVQACPDASGLEEGHRCHEARVDAQYPVSRAEIDSLPSGMYAIKVFADENANGKLDMGWNGIPDEPCGFSGSHDRLTGIPTFPMAAIEIGGGRNVQRIILR